ncbi:TRP-domain-containing protein [Lipomyces japonicus]|uniref:TRP-domain-containing protein n=1 Tax=Lipomyces japonicus TaxID=56871 RepID=UPI0034CD942A
MRSSFLLPALVASVTTFVAAADVISTNQVYTCDSSAASIFVNDLSIQYDRQSKNVTFNIQGSSAKSQNVSATLDVTAYGKHLFSYSFDPCAYDISQICPIPEGTFHAQGVVPIPDKYASQIPAIAFAIPDLDGFAQLTLNSTDSDDGQQTELACFQSAMTNGKTADLPVVSAVTGAIAAGLLGISTISMITSAAGGGTGTSSVGFSDFVSWTQNMAMNGMLSIKYPTVYQSFSQNFGWSNALISWKQMQTAIDNLRSNTGGNLTRSSWPQIVNSQIIDYQTGAIIVTNASDDSTTSSLVKRFDLDGITFSNSTSVNTSSSLVVLSRVNGVGRYIEHMTIPNANTFLTVLMFFAIILAAIMAGILIFKLALEVRSRYKPLSKSLESFRKRYWLFLGSTIIRTILILYGTWVLYCLYQFRLGDSWAAILLAGITLGIFTFLLAAFTVRIFFVAYAASKRPGGIEELYDHKPWIRRYGIFYGQYRTKYWWFFVLIIALAIGRSAFIALGDGHGLLQVVGQLALECVFAIVLLLLRPFNTRTGNVINTIICVVRIASLACVLVFVEELGVTAETTTIVGMVLIVVQSVLTVLLALLIIINGVIGLVAKNPRRKRINDDDVTEMQSLRDNKLAVPPFQTKSFLYDQNSINKTMNVDGKSGQDIGLAITSDEAEPLHPTSSTAPLKREIPWDDESVISNLEREPLARQTSDNDEAFRHAGIDHDRNGRPLF